MVGTALVDTAVSGLYKESWWSARLSAIVFGAFGLEFGVGGKEFPSRWLSQQLCMARRSG